MKPLTLAAVKPTIAVFLSITLIVAPVIDSIPYAVSAQVQDTCEEILAQAETKYQEGLLEEAIRLVNACLNLTDISDDHRERAYKLLGKSYHAQGLLDRAKDNLKKLLELIPNWQPDPDVDTPSFQRLAEQVIQELQREQEEQPTEEPPAQPQETEQPTQPTEKGGSKALLFIGGGGAVVAGLVFALAGGGGGDENGGNGPILPQQLPDPPDLPPDR